MHARRAYIPLDITGFVFFFSSPFFHSLSWSFLSFLSVVFGCDFICHLVPSILKVPSIVSPILFITTIHPFTINGTLKWYVVKNRKRGTEIEESFVHDKQALEKLNVQFARTMSFPNQAKYTDQMINAYQMLKN